MNTPKQPTTPHVDGGPVRIGPAMLAALEYIGRQSGRTKAEVGRAIDAARGGHYGADAVTRLQLARLVRVTRRDATGLRLALTPAGRAYLAALSVNRRTR